MFIVKTKESTGQFEDFERAKEHLKNIKKHFPEAKIWTDNSQEAQKHKLPLIQ